MQFNINDYVKIKLTPLGRKIMFRHWEELKRAYKGRLDEMEMAIEEDDEGWHKIQLWQLMQTFGSHVGNGSPLCFETWIEIPEKATS